MAKYNPDIYRFNAGLISDLGQVRKDLKRLALSADVSTNWMPRSLGSMSLRCGMEYCGATLSNNKAYHVPFVFSANDTAILEFTQYALRVRVNEEVVTRVAVSSAVTNGAFTSDITGWTDGDESGATSAWATGGYLSLTGTGFNRAIVTQEVTVAAGDQNKEHALNIVVDRHGVFLRIGSLINGEQYISETFIGEGTHSIAFTPTGNFFIYLANETRYAARVNSVAVAATGVMSLTTPYIEAALKLIRVDQSGDVIFVACDGYAQYKVERRSATSWSFVKYLVYDGPFGIVNTGYTTITPSALTGSVTLTASHSLFKAGHVGSFWRILSFGQSETADLAGDAQTTDSIEITGTGTQRYFSYTITGTWAGTIILQRSVGEEGSWETVSTYINTNASVVNYNDTFSNQTIYYRLYMSAYTSGTATAALTYSGGTTYGIARVTGFTSGTAVTADVVENIGKTIATTDWYEGQWSDYRGYPSAIRFVEGRLFWGGRDKITGSVSDAYSSFDDSITGNSAPINRSIGSGPVDSIKWILDLQRMGVGGEAAEHFFFSSSLDEPLTNETFNRRSPTTQGSADVAAIKLDNTGIYVQRSGTRLNVLNYDASTYQYGHDEITKFYPEAGEPSIVKIAIQMQPDKRIHCIKSDGKAFVVVYSKVDEINCIINLDTDGDIEDVVVLPGATEDTVYYTVKRTINSSTVRYFEKFAMEYECSQPTYVYEGASVTLLEDLPYPNGCVVTVRDSSGTKVESLTVSNYSVTLSTASTYARLDPAILKLADSFYEYTGAATTTITGLSHLEGESVVCFGDGKNQGTFTVTSGEITLAESVEKAIVGLPYTAKWRSVKLAYGAEGGSAFGFIKSLYGFTPLLKNTHYQGLKYGPDFDNLDNMPLIEDGKEVEDDYIWHHYEKAPFEFDGDYEEDPRVCLQAEAPNPCTVLGIVMQMEMFET